MKNTGQRIFRARRVMGMLLAALVAGAAAATTYTAQIDTTDVAGQASADIVGVFEGALPVLVTAIGLMIGWKYLKRFFLGV